MESSELDERVRLTFAPESVDEALPGTFTRVAGSPAATLELSKICVEIESSRDDPHDGHELACAGILLLHDGQRDSEVIGRGF